MCRATVLLSKLQQVVCSLCLILILRIFMTSFMQVAAALAGPGCEQILEGKAQDEKNRTDPDDTIKDTTEMNPETPTSPTTSMATLRYRWSKTVPTSSPEVIFIQSDRENEPIKLTWTESSDCFYSSEMALPCGNFSGKLVVDGTDYPVEDLLIKHYTFEADLFIREGMG